MCLYANLVNPHLFAKKDNVSNAGSDSVDCFIKKYSMHIWNLMPDTHLKRAGMASTKGGQSCTMLKKSIRRDI